MTSPPDAGQSPASAPLSQTALLEQILARLDRMEQRLELLGQASDALPGFGGMVTDILDERLAVAQERGLDVDASLSALGDLLLQLANPRSLRILSVLVEQLPKLEPILAHLDQLPGLIAMTVDSIDEALAKAQARGHRIEDIVRNAFLAASKVVAILESPEVHGLLESGILAPEAIAVVSEASHALAAARNAAPGKAGLFALWRATRKPEMQRATDFLIRFAGAFGDQLDKRPPGLPGSGTTTPAQLPHRPQG